MLIDLLRFEWGYHVRQVSFWGAVFFFVLLGFVLTATGFGPENLAVNSPFLVAQSIGFLSLFSVFAVAIFVSNAMLRDGEHRLEEIVLSTPVDRFRYLFIRSAGAFLAGLTAAAGSTAGMVAATFVPWLAPERVASLSLGPYAWAFAVLTIPNVLFVTAVLFAIAALTRSSIATYVGAVFIYVLYFVGAALTSSPLMAASTPGAETGVLAALSDPFGLSSFFEATRYWTVAEKNTRYLPLAGPLLVNRAVWTGVAAGIWIAVSRRFSFRVLGRRAKAKGGTTERSAEVASPAKAPTYAAVATRAGEVRHWLAAYASAARLETRALVGTVPFLLVLALWAAMAGSEISSSVFDGEYGSTSYPGTVLVVAALRQPLAIIGLILLVYSGAEMFWRERRYRFASIVDTTPVPGAVVVAAKWTALVALVACLIATGIAVGVAMQLAAGHRNLEPIVYLSFACVAGIPLALCAAAAVFVHTLSPGKYAGMVFVLVFLVFAQRASMLGLEHPLWRFASAPPVRFSDMNGLGGDAVPFAWFMLYWTAVAGLLLLAASALWRSVGFGVGERVRLLARRTTRTGRSLAAAMLAVAIATGGWILFNTNVLNARTTRAAVLDWQADYERTYGQFENVPQPRLTTVDVRLDLFPEDRRYRLAGSYTLANDTASPISTVFVAIRREATVENVSLEGGELVATDARFGMYRFELAAPLAPGARIRLDFELEVASRGFGGGAPEPSIVDNGSLLMSFRSFPTIGYRKTYEIADPRERSRRGLEGASVAELDGEGAHGDVDSDGAEWVDFAATVSTSADQTAIAPGRLEAAWKRDGRRFFRYVSDAPMLNRFAFASARYEVATRRHGNRDIEVYYHAGHQANVDRMLDAAADALDVLEADFGAYPHRQLRIAEVPSYWDFGAFAMPATIFVTENRGFLTDSRDPQRLDLVTRRIAHEVAHQWWGHGVVPANAEGATLLVESLAKYSELLVMERRFGRSTVRRMLAVELDRYLAGRSREERSEVPLYRVGNQAYLYYGKGAVVMYAIRDLIGGDRMRAAVGGLIAVHAGPGGRATTLDLLEQLRQVTTGRDFALIEEWLKEIVLYDLSVESASVRRLDDGRYEVTVRVSGSRVTADGAGNETARELDEAVDVAVFDVHPDEAESAGSVLERRRVVMRSGITEVRFLVDRAPAYVVVDPDITRVDKNRLDNVAGL